MKLASVSKSPVFGDDGDEKKWSGETANFASGGVGKLEWTVDGAGALEEN